MGPGWRGRGGRRPFLFATAVRSKRPGEVPVYDEELDVRAYRRAVIDWIKFHDLADKDSDRQLSLGQQVFAILGNTRGNASYRLAHISSMVYAELTLEEFGQLVDYILNTIDPLQRETAFLYTSIQKRHGKS
ncbi:hypothetical protein FGB62_224g08 [Gracilaria domingensis]|nr:hypothetical protein FGB62_224g08 [Gracilaria domingensis]